MKRLVVCIMGSALVLTSCGRQNATRTPVAEKTDESRVTAKDNPPGKTPQGKTSMLLSLADGQSGYEASGMAGVAMDFKLVDGNMVYEPVKVTCPITGIFRDKKYEATFRGILGADAGGNAMQAPSQYFRGLVKGTLVAVDDLSWNPNVDTANPTTCRILDEYPTGRFLVDGTIYFSNRPILVGPGSTIENARTDKAEVRVADSSGQRRTVAFGEKVRFDSKGTPVQ